MREEVQRFPVLRPASGWDDDAVWDYVHDFFIHKGEKVTAGVLAQTNDVDSMARYLRKAVRYYLVSRARKTPMGAIRGKSRGPPRLDTRLRPGASRAAGCGAMALEHRRGAALRRGDAAVGRGGL